VVQPGKGNDIHTKFTDKKHLFSHRLHNYKIVVTPEIVGGSHEQNGTGMNGVTIRHLNSAGRTIYFAAKIW
jgi:hypothetical protein